LATTAVLGTLPIGMTDTLLARLEALLPTMQDRAAALDASATFPTDDIADLRQAGVLFAPVPARFGGPGIGTEPQQAGAALDLFRLLGRGNLALGTMREPGISAACGSPTRRTVA
jgi:alkylation response protein AidB-like acyl-CoA dehydrogenase